MIYENNTELTHSERKRLHYKDLTQREAVLQVLRSASHSLTDAEIRENAIRERLIHPKTLLTSIRRARSDLKKADIVVEGPIKREGGHGVETKTWRLATSNEEGQTDMFGAPKSRHQQGVTL